MSLMIKDLFKNASQYENKEILISGWVRTVRVSKVFGFIELNDGTFFNSVQVVFEEDKIFGVC